MLFTANSAISWREQVNFQWDDDKVCFVLDQHIRKRALKHGIYHFTFWSPFHEFSGQNLKINLPFSYRKPKETNKKTSVFVSCLLSVFWGEDLCISALSAIGLPTKWPSFYSVIAIILHNKGYISIINKQTLCTGSYMDHIYHATISLHIYGFNKCWVQIITANFSTFSLSGFDEKYCNVNILWWTLKWPNGPFMS